MTAPTHALPRDFLDIRVAWTDIGSYLLSVDERKHAPYEVQGATMRQLIDERSTTDRLRLVALLFAHCVGDTMDDARRIFDRLYEILRSADETARYANIFRGIDDARPPR